MTTTPAEGAARGGVPLLDLFPGDTVSFSEGRMVFTVRAVTENFVAAAGHSHGKPVYTIIDWSKGRRGPHDSWGHPMIETADIERALDALERSKASYDEAAADPTTGTPEGHPWPHLELELSVRHSVRLEILSVHRGTALMWPVP